MSRALALLKSSHPEPGGAVTVAMTLLAVGVGHRGWSIVGVFLAVAATQFTIGWVNDWLDADRDRVAGRTDKPVAAGAVSPRAVGLAGLISAVAVPFLGLPFGWAATILITLVAVFGLLYDWPLKSTALSVVPYLVAFALLPAFVVVALPGHPAPPAWLVAAGGLLGGGAHFANVLPDLAADLRTGVRGLPQQVAARWGPGSARVIALALLLSASALLVAAAKPDRRWVAVAGLCCSALLAVTGLFGRGRTPFRAALGIAGIDVAVFVLGADALT
jgi:protoheme IX farnesyltransferase